MRGYVFLLACASLIACTWANNLLLGKRNSHDLVLQDRIIFKPRILGISQSATIKALAPPGHVISYVNVTCMIPKVVHVKPIRGWLGQPVIVVTALGARSWSVALKVTICSTPIMHTTTTEKPTTTTRKPKTTTEKPTTTTKKPTTTTEKPTTTTKKPTTTTEKPTTTTKKPTTTTEKPTTTTAKPSTTTEKPTTTTKKPTTTTEKPTTTTTESASSTSTSTETTSSTVTKSSVHTDDDNSGEVITPPLKSKPLAWFKRL